MKKVSFCLILAACSVLAQKPAAIPPYSQPVTVVPQKWFGGGPPTAAIITPSPVQGPNYAVQPGDVYYDTVNGINYWCSAPWGTPVPACVTVSAGQWVAQNSYSSIYTPEIYGGTAVTSSVYIYPSSTSASSLHVINYLPAPIYTTISTSAGSTAVTVTGSAVGLAPHMLVCTSSFVAGGTCTPPAGFATNTTIQSISQSNNASLTMSGNAASNNASISVAFTDGTQYAQMFVPADAQVDSVTKYFDPTFNWSAYNPSAPKTPTDRRQAEAFELGVEGNYLDAGTFDLARFYLFDHVDMRTIFHMDVGTIPAGFPNPINNLFQFDSGIDVRADEMIGGGYTALQTSQSQKAAISATTNGSQLGIVMADHSIGVVPTTNPANNLTTQCNFPCYAAISVSGSPVISSVSSSSGQVYYGIWNYPVIQGSANFSQVIGNYSGASYAGTGTLRVGLVGAYYFTDSRSNVPSVVANSLGNYNFNYTNPVTVGNSWALNIDSFNDVCCGATQINVSGSIYGIEIGDQNASGAIGSGTFVDGSYGLSIDQTASANSWALYASGGAISYFKGNVGIGLTTPGAPAPLTVGTTGQFQVSAAGAVTAPTYSTSGNCSSSTSPAVCSSYASGSVAMAAAATTLVVNTTAVTANSQILLTFDSSLGTKLGVTCNTTTPSLYRVSARTAATSFTITATASVTNPACFSYTIIN